MTWQLNFINKIKDNKMKRIDKILNSIEHLTYVDFSLLLEDQTFRSKFLTWFNVDKLDDTEIITNSVDYIKDNF